MRHTFAPTRGIQHHRAGGFACEGAPFTPACEGSEDLTVRGENRVYDMTSAPGKAEGEAVQMEFRGSRVIQIMLQRLAEEEEQLKREKTAGSVGTAKPLAARAAGV